MQSPVSDPAEEIIYHVDARDKVIDSVSRGEMRADGLCHRVTYLLVFNNAGEILVQTRTDTKDWYPGSLDFAAGGVVLAGESYEVSGRRELEEELGITEPLEPQFDIYFEDNTTTPSTRSWGRVFTCTSEGPFELQVEEVAAAEFMSIDAVLGIDRSQVTPDTRQVLLAYIS
jgi:8-oxo-dGTP pyrophosphatase MutT (NUDIX family)